MSSPIHRRLSVFVRYLPLVLGLLCLSCTFIYAGYTWGLFSQFTKYGTIFWFHQTIYTVPKCLFIIFPFLNVALIGTQLFVLRHQRNGYIAVTVLGVVLVAAWMLSCIASITTVFGVYTMHDELLTESYVYRLDSQWKVGVGGASRAAYFLWECDKSGLVCHKVQSVRIPPIYPESEYQSTEAVLRMNPNTDQIEFVLGGDVMFSYPE